MNWNKWFSQKDFTAPSFQNDAKKKILQMTLKKNTSCANIFKYKTRSFQHFWDMYKIEIEKISKDKGRKRWRKKKYKNIEKNQYKENNKT